MLSTARIYVKREIEDVITEAVGHTGRNQVPPFGPPESKTLLSPSSFKSSLTLYLAARYAHVFGGGESVANFSFYGACASKEDRFEFPIMPGGNLFNGTADQGIDRVVYSRIPSLEKPT
jgi:hypothetical protein